MKRPIILGGLGVLLGALAGTYGFWSVPLIVVGILIIYFQTQQLKINNSYGFILVMVGVICFVFIWSSHLSYDREVQKLSSSKTISGAGIVKEYNHGEYSTVYTLYPWWNTDGVKQPYAINISSVAYSDIGYRVSFEGRVRDQMSGYNEGAFDAAKYYKEQRIVGLIKGNLFNDRLTGRYRFRKWLLSQRGDHYSQLVLLLPERYSKVIGNLLLGIDGVEAMDRELFQASGIIHILAISGLHVTMIAGMLFWFISQLSRRQSINALAVFLLIVIYCFYTGGHTSTVRATVMIGIFLGHRVFYRKYDQHTALMTALVLMILINPFQLFSAGFLLSFGAVLSIFYITPKLIFGFLDLENGFVQLLKIMLAIQIGMTPLLIHFFGHIPLYSFIANLLVLPIVALLIAFSGLGIGFSYVHLLLGKWVAGGAFWLVTYMFDVVALINRLPYSYVQISSPGVLVLSLYYVALILWLTSYGKASAALVVVMLAITITFPFINADDLRIDMMDVGNGDAVFVRCEGQVMLFDGGGLVGRDGPNVGETVLLPYLNKHGIKNIDTVVISHSDFDHVYGIIELMSQIPITRLIMPTSYLEFDNDWSRRLKMLAEVNNIELLYAENGDHVEVGALNLDFLYPMDSIPHEDNNSNSTVVLMSYEGLEMLFTGDIGVEDERLLLDKHKELLAELDVLKVAHHGSKTSTDEAFIATVSPVVSLVSVGRENIYGHPSKAVSERLYRYSDHVYMTKDSGQITVTYNNGELLVDQYME